MQFETVCSKKTTNNKSSKSSAKHWTKMTDEEMKEVYGNYTKEIVGECNVSVEKLNEYLKDKGVLKDKGQAFLDAEKEYNINAVALIAICMNESNKGSSDLAKNKNNVGGVRKSGSTEFMEFDKVENCIDYMAKLLKNNYVDNGLKKLYQVNAKYCPSAETQSNAGWAHNVNHYMDELSKLG
ncbi:MAG: glucosaminidase domain-containing protein, partial [bacterium]|nr:glucosaminidase domain-containing protein [bacterium]